jgi:hypothetical protein
MVLLIVFSLFMPGSGFLSGSQSANAQALKNKNESARAKIRSARPSEDLGKVPGELTAERASQTQVAAAPYRGNGDSFSPHPPDNTKRRMPHILSPTEAKGTDLLAQFRTYIFQPNTNRIGVIRGLEAGASQLPTGPRGGMGPRGPAGAFGGGGNRPGGAMMGPGAMGPGAAMNPGSAGVGQGPRGGSMGGMPGMGPTGQVDAGIKEGKFEWQDMDKVDNLDELAETLRPMPIVEVVASFPFKKQVEEFRDALRKNTLGELFADPRGVPTIKDLVVQRSEIQPDGSNGAWVPLDFSKEYKNIYIEGGRRREQEDPALQPILEYSLLMPRPLQYRDGRYASLEKELTDVKNTLQAIKDIGKANLPKSNAQTVLDKKGTFNAFGQEDVADTGVPGSYGPGGMRPPAGIGGAGRPDPGTPPPATGSEDIFVPEACLVRFLDVTVEPGKTYDYRVQIVMVNPNYKLTDQVAFPEIAREETLKSQWSPTLVRVPVHPDLTYYVTDEKENERGKQARREFNGAPDVSGDRERVAMQIHKWFAGIVPPSNTEWFPSGEWLLADRVIVHRGEYIGRNEKAEVPIWLYTRKGFVIAVNVKQRGTKKEIDANFGFEKKPPDEAILVDFEGGKVSHDRAPEKAATDDKKASSVRITDNAPLEALILMPDGRLLCRDSKTDTADTKRTDRRIAWRERIEEVKGKSTPKKAAGAGNDLFDNRPGGGK